MYLHSIRIKGFRKLEDVTVNLSGTTFLIGPNNAGKSSILKAIELLLSSKDKIEEDNYYKENNDATPVDIIELEGEFRGIDKDVIGNKNWRGFNAKRVLKYKNDKEETDYRIFYKKIYRRGAKSEFYMKELQATPKEKYLRASSYKELIDAGLNIDKLELSSEEINKSIKKSRDYIDEIYELEDFWDYSSEESWVSNPGGFSSNVISKLPKFLLIPPQDKSEEYDERKGTLYDILNELFEDVRQQSPNYQEAIKYLKELQKEFDPQDSTTEFGKMINDLNHVIQGVFPSANLSASAILTGTDSLKPAYGIELGSNINTKPQYQGTGQLRAAVFALLRYKEERDKKKNLSERNLIIGFEEPELYLHPHAAYQMKEVIYELSDSNQIICTTHSPYMIDLSKAKKQILNKLHIRDENDKEIVKVIPFNLSQEFSSLVDNEKDYLKMFLKMDDEVSKIFFSKKVLIVEGDTEEIVLKQYINLLPKTVKDKLLSSWSILKARGKPVIISILKYLKAMRFKEIKVMHDGDYGVEKAECYNPKIKEALECDDNLFVLDKCIEDILGYDAPSSDKPYKAYMRTLEWKNYSNIPQKCKDIFEKIFELSSITNSEEDE